MMRKSAALWIFIALFLKSIEWYLVPLAHIDAFGTLGEIFTSDLYPSKNYFYNTGSLYFSGYLAFPFFQLFHAQHSVFVFYSLFSLVALILIWNTSQSHYAKQSQLVFLAAVLTPYLYLQRSEVIGLSICLIFLYLEQKNFDFKLKYPVLMVVLIASYFAHPVAFICSAYLMSLHWIKRNDFTINPFQKRVIWGLLITMTLSLWVYFNQSDVWSYYQGHLLNRLQTPSLKPMLMFFIYNSILAVMIFLITLELRAKERFMLAGYLIVLLILKRDFYFVYLSPIAVYYVNHQELSLLNRKGSLTWMYPLIGLSAFITFINPILIKAENSDYIKVARKIPQVLSTISLKSDQHIHIDPAIASSFVLRSSTTQIIIGEQPSEFYPRNKIEQGDIIYLKSPLQLNTLRKHHQIHVSTLIEPVSGPLSARSIYSVRQDSLGLFECEVIK